MSKTLLLCLVLCALVLIGCAKSESSTNREAAPPASPKASPATTTNTASTAPAADKTGVAECDAFIAAYENCVRDKVPAAQRATFESSLSTWKKSWHDLATNPQTKGTLAAACKTQIDAARTSMKAFGCTF
ncbi:MAG TPA: hypothetical protein VKB46_06745 [Pyrinomonadaceae bacterium]|nr:hypothetical protein [Pyrinomonadaceae bacterium]